MKKSDDSVFLQNIRLSLISLPMAIVTIMSDYEIIEKSKLQQINKSSNEICFQTVSFRVGIPMFG